MFFAVKNYIQMKSRGFFFQEYIFVTLSSLQEEGAINVGNTVKSISLFIKDTTKSLFDNQTIEKCKPEILGISSTNKK